MQTAKENGETILTQKKMSGNKLKQPREIHVREILECLFFQWAVHPKKSNGGSIMKYGEVPVWKYWEVPIGWDPQQILIYIF